MWTQFWDMHSGGRLKTQWDKIYIEAPEAEARIIFYNRFGINPERVSCTCCGEDFVVNESETLEQASGYDRGCAYENGQYVEVAKYPDSYVTLEEYKQNPNKLFIYAKDIKDEEREGMVPIQGYVWA